MTTTTKKLHPSIQKFKEFVQGHPKMIREVHGGTKTWQQFYEEWYLLGENDAIWDTYRDNEGHTVAATKENDSGESKNFMGQMLSLIKNIDMDQVQYHLGNVTNAIGSVQQVIQQFQVNPSSSSQEHQNERNNPFFFQKD